VVEKIKAHRIWWGNLKERNHLVDFGVDGTINLNEFKQIGRKDLN
jgi:hypothetical protein